MLVQEPHQHTLVIKYIRQRIDYTKDRDYHGSNPPPSIKVYVCTDKKCSYIKAFDLIHKQ